MRTAYLKALSELAAKDKNVYALISDNGIIDSVLGGHLNDSTAHLTQQEKDKALQPYTTMIYAGSGEATRTIQIGFRPSVTFVYKKNAPAAVYGEGVNVVNSACCSYGDGATSGVSIASNGVTVTQQSTAQNGVRISLNETGCQYVVIALK